MLGILLAAGRGTRMKSSRPKVLFDINDEPLCFPAFRALFELCDRVLVVVGYRGADVREHLLKRANEAFGEEAVKAKVLFYTQEEQKGTGHAVRTAIEGLGKGVAPFEATLVVNGDLPLVRVETLQPLLEEFQSKKLDSLCLSFDTDAPTGFGRILREGSGAFYGIREEKDANDTEKAIREVNGGVYCFRSSILAASLQALKTDNQQNEFYLTDLLGLQKQPELKTAALKTNEAEDLLGVNTTYELAELRIKAQRRLKRLLCEKHGVDFISLDSSFVSARATFQGPCRIGPSCSIMGTSIIGEDVILEGHVLVKNSRVAKGAELLWSTVVDESIVGERSRVGPMAHLRPGTSLGEEVRIGNFVETKKASFDRGSKASHLSYIGDAEIGEDSNIGAGTITCNYDGFNKFRTKIGKRAFVGSDSQLVAPVTIGDEAYVGSGTTVTEDVPAGALAISRPDMVVKEGYAKKLAAKRNLSKKD
jgi:bifunctional UDP-N-acetylglucosamine pyrophosphorylase / glucosamine-1-phosphate N-acetyltransferase